MRIARRCRFLTSLLLLGLTLGAVAGCGGGGSSPGPPPPPPGPLTITTQSLPRGVHGVAYTASLQATGGTPPYTWTADTQLQPLPPGLSLSSGGVISGAPTAAGFFGPAFTVRDTQARSAVVALGLPVSEPLVLPVGPLPDANIATPYFAPVPLSGGLFPYTWSLAAGSAPLPPGLSLNSSQGVVSGTPTNPGSYSFSLQVVDGGVPPLTASQSFNLLVRNDLVLVTTQLPFGVINQPYAGTLQAAGGTPPYRWQITGGQPLPDGLTFDGVTGTISGTPLITGVAFIAVAVSDSASPPATKNSFVSLPIRAQLAFVTLSLPDASTGGYSAFLFVDGGVPPLNLRVSSGALPDGVNFTRQTDFGPFIFSGAPTRESVFDFTLELSDSSSPPRSTTRDFSVRISKPISFAPPPLPDTLEGSNVSVTFTATGGFPPYRWSSFLLPQGFSLDADTGTLTGTAVTSAFFGISVQDSSNPPLQAGGVTFLRVVGRLRLTTTRLPAVATNRTILFTPEVIGGTAPFHWSISSGALPQGINSDPNTGTFSGSASAAAVANFTLTVADSGTGALAQAASQPLVLAVKDPGQIGRNDAISTATPLSNGLYRASISPLADPPNVSSANPDVDVFNLTANPGATVRVEALIGGITPPSALDPVIEIVDENGSRLNLCSNSFFNPNGPFNQPCMNDDFVFGGLEAKLLLQVPANAAAPLTFYVRVLDFRGDARPDFLYNLQVSGAN